MTILPNFGPCNPRVVASGVFAAVPAVVCVSLLGLTVS